MAMCTCVCSGEWKVDDVWEPLCIKAKPAAAFMEEMAVNNEMQVLQAVQRAMQTQPGPHHLSYLLAYYPPGSTAYMWAENQQEVWFITE